VFVVILFLYSEDPGFRVPYGSTGHAGGGWGHGLGDGQSHHSYGGFPQGFVSWQCFAFESRVIVILSSDPP